MKSGCHSEPYSFRNDTPAVTTLAWSAKDATTTVTSPAKLAEDAPLARLAEDATSATAEDATPVVTSPARSAEDATSAMSAEWPRVPHRR